MRIFFILLLFPLLSLAQTVPEPLPVQKLSLRTKILTDSGMYKGYLIKGTDSAIQISHQKKYDGNSIVNIPVNNIRELEIRNSTGLNAVGVTAVTVIGFLLTAGLTKNGGDVNDDGETSFFELLFTAIEGTTSKNRHRRNTALIVGAAGGTVFLVAALLSTKKLSISFPLSNRNQFYTEKKAAINNYIKF